MSCYEYIISSKRAGDYTNTGTVVAGKGGERAVKNLVVGSGTGVCEGDIQEK